MNYQITSMTSAHLDQVAALEKLCFPEDPWSRRLLAEALENENTASLLALSEDGHVLGYLFFTTVLDEGGVDNIAVKYAEAAGHCVRPAGCLPPLRTETRAGQPLSGGAGLQPERLLPLR